MQGIARAATTIVHCCDKRASGRRQEGRPGRGRVLETALVIADPDIAPDCCLLPPLLIHRREDSAASGRSRKTINRSPGHRDDLELPAARTCTGDSSASSVRSADLKSVARLVDE